MAKAECLTNRSVKRWRVMAWIGWTLIGMGAFLLLFVVYTLWGTRLHTAAAQERLKSEFDARDVPAHGEPVGTQQRSGDQALFEALLAERNRAAERGEAIARIQIPRIGVDSMVVAGTDTLDLRNGPGNMLETAVPGGPGNAVVSAHRTTYGAEFHRLDEVQAGDEMLIDTLAGHTVYKVRGNTDPLLVPVLGDDGKEETVEIFGVQVVQHSTPDDKKAAARNFMAQAGPSRITLTTCNPKFSARERLIVVADMVEGPFVGFSPDLSRIVKPTTSELGPDG